MPKHRSRRRGTLGSTVHRVIQRLADAKKSPVCTVRPDHTPETMQGQRLRQCKGNAQGEQAPATPIFAV